MRLADLTAAQRQLLEKIAGRISTRLEAHFSELPDPETDHIGVVLRERGRTVMVEVGRALLVDAADDAVAFETLRNRLKGRRDRMLFRPPPAALPKHIAPLFDANVGRGRGGGGGGGGYGRR